MRTLVAWCPDWPVTAAGFAPDDHVAVLHANRVVAASAIARAAGVLVGQRRRDAESRCPGLVVFARDPTLEARMFEPVVAAVAALAPRVEVIRPGLLAIDARGPSRYFEGEEALCRRIIATSHGAMSADGSPVPVCGVADGRFAATMAARQGAIVSAGGNAAFLAPFPVDVLDRADVADLLRRIGITTLGAFAALPASSVLARFGTDAARAHALARGLSDDSSYAERPAIELAVATDFDPPVDRVDLATFAGRSLATELTEQLDRRGLACARLRIEAETEHGESFSRLWRGDEHFGAGAMVERLRWQLDGWLSGTVAEPAPTAGITHLVLAADGVVPATNPQLGFWGGPSHTDRRAAQGLDRLRGMLGPDAVFTAILRGGRGPHDRVSLVPWGDPRPERDPMLPWPGHHPLPAPALVHPTPLAAEVIDIDGRTVAVSARGKPSGAPGSLSVAGGPWLAIVGWGGPWLADERWWDPRSRHRRARFQVVVEGEAAHLCTVEDGRWRIEATYD